MASPARGSSSCLMIDPSAPAVDRLSPALALEAAKYLNMLFWPLLSIKLTREYGPFFNSAAIIKHFG